MSEHAWDEGHTIAGWTGFFIAVAGSTLVALGMTAPHALALWSGLGLIVLSPLVTWMLHLMGWGKPGGVRPAGQWGMRVRDLTARGGHSHCVACRLAGRRPTADRVPAARREPAPVERGGEFLVP